MLFRAWRASLPWFPIADRAHREVGLLVEMLAAGVPVIVPAGSWLAEQIAEPSFDYAEQIGRRLDQVSGERDEDEK